MDEPVLKSGDKVIALASVVRSVSLLSGGFSAGFVNWMVNYKFIIAAGYAFAGDIVGYLVGYVISRLLFPASKGRVRVIRAGMPSLPLTLKAGIIGAAAASLLNTVLVNMITRSELTFAFIPSVGFSLLIGIVLACLVSLL
jgi:hypothetical protein